MEGAGGGCTHLVAVLAELTGGTHGRPRGCAVLEPGGDKRGHSPPKGSWGFSENPKIPHGVGGGGGGPYPLPWLVALPRRCRWWEPQPTQWNTSACLLWGNRVRAGLGGNRDPPNPLGKPPSPGRGFDLGLAREDPDENTHVEVGADREQRHHEALVAVGAEVEAVQDDPQGLPRGQRGHRDVGQALEPPPRAGQPPQH